MIILLKNKYPVLEDTLQTVLIESDECDAELSTYSKEHLYKVIRFGVKHWLEMEQSGEFTSVLFYKNHGALSGGSLAHPHMQIVGLTQVDYREHVKKEHFEGITIDAQPGVQFNISTKPRVGFFKFNVILSEMNEIDRMADDIQAAAHYVLNHFNQNCHSYNLFFYPLGNDIAVKIIPRFPTSPPIRRLFDLASIDSAGGSRYGYTGQDDSHPFQWSDLAGFLQQPLLAFRYESVFADFRDISHSLAVDTCCSFVCPHPTPRLL